MKILLVKPGILLLSLCLLVSCNNGSKDKTVNSSSTQGDTSATKDDTTTHQATTNEQTPAAPFANLKDYQYEPTVSVITGTIKTESFYGPPGFGEHPKTDSREEVYLLVLEKPINVISTAKENDDDANTTKNNVLKIQLISPDNINLANYKNKTVRLTGTFFGPETGHHHTDVLMDIQQADGL
jgi:hypothetical protein